MKIALAQTNPVIGDFAANSAGILRHIECARSLGCALVVFPELALCGYPPCDLLERGDFLQSHNRKLEELVGGIHGITCILGVLEERRGPGKPLYNAAVVVENGKVLYRAHKQLLPTYDVFDERRYFEPGGASTVFYWQGLCIGLSVCEDIWYAPDAYARDPVQAMIEAAADSPLDLLINISASPYSHGKLTQRRDIFSRLCREKRVPLVYVNQAAGQDSLIFDGHSMVLDDCGQVRGCACGFAEDLLVVDTEDWQCAAGQSYPEDSPALVREALCLGLRDYLHKTGFSSVVLGLSGGIDSAVTAALACRALGPDKVLTVALPSPYTSGASVADAQALADNFGCSFQNLPIAALMTAYATALAPLFSGLPEDVTEQNIQARIRGNLLMALSNKLGVLLLSTGNKSEMAVGYCTLYGDMSGGLAVLSDVPKVMVYQLAELFNVERELIPRRIISRAPTAELKPDQFDQDDLPPYEVLDPILTAYLEEQLDVAAIVAQGFERRVVEDIIRRIHRSEHKRKQAPLGLRVTSKAFGPGRRYPIAHHFPG